MHIPTTRFIKGKLEIDKQNRGSIIWAYPQSFAPILIEKELLQYEGKNITIEIKVID